MMTKGTIFTARRRLLGAALLATAAAGLAALPAMAENAKPPAGKIYKVGYSQIVEHPALDETRRGLLAGLEAAGFVQAKNLVFDYQNANGDVGNARIIAEKFMIDKVDVMTPCTTPNTLAALKVTKGTKMPVVFGCVTNPVQSGILASTDKPTGTNVTGIYGLPPIAESFDLFLKVKPGLKRMGTIYNASETNSLNINKAAKAEAEKRGIQWVEVAVTSSAEVKTATESLVGKVDALVTGQDNTVASAYEAVVKVARDAHLPLFAMDVSAVGRGAVIALAQNQFQAGVDWAREVVVPVLLGKDPGTIKPVRTTRYDLQVNLDAAKAGGVTVPADLVAKAAKKFGG
jgi:putative tryptophan/tyrosine transport system substrate-binding protein